MSISNIASSANASSAADSDLESAVNLVDCLSIETNSESESVEREVLGTHRASDRVLDAGNVGSFASRDVRLVPLEARNAYRVPSRILVTGSDAPVAKVNDCLVPLDDRATHSAPFPDRPKVRSRGNRPSGAARKRRARAISKVAAAASSAEQQTGMASAAPKDSAGPSLTKPAPNKKRPRGLDTSSTLIDVQPSPKRIFNNSDKASNGSCRVLLKPSPNTSTHLPTLNPLSFREILSEELMVVIFDPGCPDGKYDQDQANNILETIDEALDSEMNLQTYVPILFGNRRFHEGFIRVHCSDNRALEWLKDKVATFKSTDGTSNLKVISEINLPKLIKMTIWIKGKKLSRDIISLRLRAQNPHLKVERWSFLNHIHKPESGGQIAVFGIPEDTIKILEKQEYFAYFGMCTVRFKGSYTSAEELPRNGS